VLGGLFKVTSGSPADVQAVHPGISAVNHPH
jgi:hypothetical protein